MKWFSVLSFPLIWPFTALHRLYNFLDPFRLLFSTVLFLILEQPLNQPLNSYLSTILLFYSFFPLKKKKSYIPWKPFIQNSYPLLLLLPELPRWLSDKKSACQWRRCGSSPWVGKIPWRRKWQPTPVFLPGKPHGQRSLAGYSSWGCKKARHNSATKQNSNNKKPYYF